MLADDLREIAEWMGQQECIGYDPEFAACLWARAAILQSIAARLEGRVVVKPVIQPVDSQPFVEVFGKCAATIMAAGYGESPEAAIADLQMRLDKEAESRGSQET